MRNRRGSYEWRTVEFHPAPAGWRVGLPPWPGQEDCVEVAMPGWLVQEEMFYDHSTDGYVVEASEDGLPIPRTRRIVASLLVEGTVEAVDDEAHAGDVFVVLGPYEQFTEAHRECLKEEAAIRRQREQERRGRAALDAAARSGR
jgi:hypothetical protein